ncbi:MAG: creatininase family protein [Lentisphaerae bacterium]|nr:creatininase family protein [Lentisphaerota bacterium]
MRLSHLSWVQVQEYFKSNDLVVLSCGSIEEHGKHNPLGVDSLVPDRLLDLIEEKCSCLIAPTMPYGATDDLTAYPGTIDIGQETMRLVMQSIADSLIEHGAKRFVVVNGHGGNANPLDRISLNLHRRGYWMAVFNWWTTAGSLNPDWDGGHGSFQETAAVLGVDPKLVHYEYMDDEHLVDDVSSTLPTAGFDYVKFGESTVRMFRDTRSYATNGWLGKKHPKEATVEVGQEMLDTTADYIARFIDEFKTVPLPPVLKK